MGEDDGAVPDTYRSLVGHETVRAVAESGVDLISVGALTHSAPALDVALDFDFTAPPSTAPEA